MESNVIKKVNVQIEQIVIAAYRKAVSEGFFEDCADEGEIRIEIPQDTSYGDFSTSFAMVSAKKLRMAPIKIAQKIVELADLDNSYFHKVETAGPGFINFFLNDKWYAEVLGTIETCKEAYGKNLQGKNQKVMVEFVSANPTGPMHIGNARGGVLGDTLANVLLANGFDTYREFYVNDAGNQVHKFAVSLNARYMQMIYGEDNFEFPEEGYQGDDIRDLAQQIYAEYGTSLVDMDEEVRFKVMSDFGLKVNIPLMKSDLEKYRINYDTWFLESSLYSNDFVADTVEKMIQMDLTYEKDGALWLKTTRLLTEKYLREGKTEEQIGRLNLKDDVLKRSNGFYTYFAADIAYHRHKFEIRNFDKVINVWGVDHIGHVPRLQAALDGLGLDGSNRLVIVLMHLVNLMKDGEPVRMSKRSGKAIALRDLLEEISVDAARYFFNSRSASSAIDFDLDLAVKTDSDNPVYYIQYAYARINSLFANLVDDHLVKYDDIYNADVSVLKLDSELSLIKALALYPSELVLAANEYDPSYINRYLFSLAGAFHRFYNNNRIKGEVDEIRNARLRLANATRIVLKNGMDIIGISVLEKM